MLVRMIANHRCNGESEVIIAGGKKTVVSFSFYSVASSPLFCAKYQRAIRDVEFHLRLAIGSASKSGTGPEGEEIARVAAERLALLLCQEGRNKEAAKILKRQGFR